MTSEPHAAPPRSSRGSRERIHFLHLGKTGGTAIKAALGPYASEWNLVLHSHGTTVADVPWGDRFFFFVRDPLDRFVSAFYSRQRMGQPRHLSPWSPGERRAFSRFQSPEALASALNAPSFLLRRRARAAMTSIQHVKDSYWAWFGSEQGLARREPDIVHILFQEDLASDFSVLCARLGLPPVALPSNDVDAHRSPAHLDRSLSEAARANLLAWYSDDGRFVEACRTIAARRRVDLGSSNP